MQHLTTFTLLLLLFTVSMNTLPNELPKQAQQMPLPTKLNITHEITHESVDDSAPQLYKNKSFFNSYCTSSNVIFLAGSLLTIWGLRDLNRAKTELPPSSITFTFYEIKNNVKTMIQNTSLKKKFNTAWLVKDIVSSNQNCTINIPGITHVHDIIETAQKKIVVGLFGTGIGYLLKK